MAASFNSMCLTASCGPNPSQLTFSYASAGFPQIGHILWKGCCSEVAPQVGQT